MGTRGPLPKPEKRRRNKEPAPSGTILVTKPTKPRELTGEAAREWNRIVPVILRAGYLTKLDRGVLIRYCEAWAEWVELVELIRQSGPLVRGTKDQLIRNPLWLVRNDLQRELSRLGVMLGLAPAPRRRMNVKHVTTEAKAAEEPPAELDAYRERLRAARAADGMDH